MGDINLLWYSTRGSAIVSQILFTAVAVLGVLTAVRWQSPRWPRFLSEGLHRTLALTSLVFLAMHVVTSAIDPESMQTRPTGTRPALRAPNSSNSRMSPLSIIITWPTAPCMEAASSA